jgi:hypothetical protein
VLDSVRRYGAKAEHGTVTAIWACALGLGFSKPSGIDNLTSERCETSTRMSQIMLQQLSPHSKIDARRFETFDVSDGRSNAVEH